MLLYPGDIEALRQGGHLALRELEAALAERRFAGALWLVGEDPSIHAIPGGNGAGIYTLLWADGLIVRRGWIAVALVALGALSLGGLIAQAKRHRVALAAASAGHALCGHDHLAGIMLASCWHHAGITLAVISSNPRRMRLNTLASLGQPFSG
jgi:simple sugar transport system permease protein